MRGKTVLLMFITADGLTLGEELHSSGEVVRLGLKPGLDVKFMLHLRGGMFSPQFDCS